MICGEIPPSEHAQVWDANSFKKKDAQVPLQLHRSMSKFVWWPSTFEATFGKFDGGTTAGSCDYLKRPIYKIDHI